MKHREAWRLLNDHIDNELSGQQRVELEDHIASCPDCRREIEELRELAGSAAGLPDSIDPPNDLWPAIANTIESEKEETGLEAARNPRPDRQARRKRNLQPAYWIRAAFGFPEIRGIPTFAGAALLAVIVLMMIRPGQPPAPENLAKTDNIFVERGLRPVAEEVVLALEAECRQADRALEHFSSREGNPRMDPVLDRMNQDLRVVSQSITEISEAWKANPENPNLTRLLIRSCQAKIALQERMIEVSVIS